MEKNLIREKKYQDNLERISRLRLIDDDFMSICFDGYKEGVELVLNTILDRSDLSVVSVDTQVKIVNLENRSICLDILAVDKKHKLYNIEIQRADIGASCKRARYHSSVLDSKYLKKGMDFFELPETYIIFITENDVLGGDEPIYFIERTITNKNRLFEDGEHIIYVNASYEDDKTELGRLMHDFYCSNPEDMKNDILADRVRFFKEDDEGVKTMCKVLEEMRMEERAEGRAEGRAESLVIAYMQNEISREAVMRILDINDDEFSDLVDLYSQMI